jgi:hypothetical protein
MIAQYYTNSFFFFFDISIEAREQWYVCRICRIPDQFQNCGHGGSKEKKKSHEDSSSGTALAHDVDA